MRRRCPEVIKRIRFATGLDATRDFSVDWPAAEAGVLAAPPDVRPVRVVACTVLPEITPDHLHDGVAIEWFEDTGHLARFEAWLASPAGQGTDELFAQVLDIEASPLFVAEEHIMRGSEWMDERWRRGGATLKHMAIATRAVSLTPEQFSHLWKTRAGKVGTVVIPDAARGRAYVQNHAIPPPHGSWDYDAVNEVYFEAGDLDGIQARIDFFARTMKDNGEADLVGNSWFIVAREELLQPGGGDQAGIPRRPL
jgi:hypothetical protein